MRFSILCSLVGLVAFSSHGPAPKLSDDCGSEIVTIGIVHPGTLEAVLGQDVQGQIGSYKICQGYTMKAFEGTIDWGDGSTTRVIPGDFGKADNGKLLASPKAYVASGRFPMFVRVKATCYDSVRSGWYAVSCGRAWAVVYESAPLKAFRLSAKSIVGGNRLTGNTVTLASPSKGLGTLVRLSTTAPASVDTFVIATPGSPTVSFDIETSRVSSPVVVTITVASDNTSLSQELTVN
jgi:hypothetical protein